MLDNEKDNYNSNITKDYIDAMIHTVQNLYLADDIPWIIGYSGGKDSTATLQLVWLSLNKLQKKDLHKTVHIINTDTLVESPIISKWAKHSLEMMKKQADMQNLPIETHILTPENNNTFWVNLLGRGYPFPRKKVRWCTDRLKIKPVNNFIKNKIAEHGEIILVLGTRKAESARRARTMIKYEKKRVRELLSPNPTLANELIFSPLEDWTDQDVWIFLMQYNNPWGYSNQKLLTLYRGASSDTECPMQIQENLPSCGKSRFGCWVCTMVEQDKSMEAIIANDPANEWMTPMLEFRNEFGNEEHDRERRSFRKMDGSIRGNYGRLFHGPYKKEIREEWLEKLLMIQKEINETGPEEFHNLELISISELQEIRRIWVNEKHEFEDRLPKIYERVMGNAFPDPYWLEKPGFQEEEWKILKEICSNSKFNDEELLFEMMYSLIDIENTSTGFDKKKRLTDTLTKCIKSNFYKNETDATQYYYEQEIRKRQFGGSYNEKFLEPSYFVQESNEEEDQA